MLKRRKIKNFLKASVVLAILIAMAMPAASNVPNMLKITKSTDIPHKMLAENYMMVENVSGNAGDTGLTININGAWNQTVASYTMAFFYDPANIEVTELSFVGTVGETSSFTVINISLPGYVNGGAIWFFTPYLPEGNGTLFKVIYNIKPHATNGDTLLDLGIFEGPPVVDCRYTLPGGTGNIQPQLIDGYLTISGGNDPPNTPNSPDPGDGASNVPIDTDLSWSGGDPNGDDVVYDVYYGDSSPPPLVSPAQSGTTYDPGILDFDNTYYWQIVARDEWGAESSGPEWDFTTRDQNPPNTPSNPSPADDEIDVELDVDLDWDGGDPDGDSVVYDVYFGQTSPPPIVSTGQSGSSYDLPILDFGTTYYWQIVARDEWGAETVGPEWDFTTRINNPPNSPNTPSPLDDATEISINTGLSWSGGDPDGDSVTYDIYFGKTSPPPLETSNNPTTSYDPGELDKDTIYYWKIVARDEYDEENEGPEWDFTTETNNAPNEPNDPDPEDHATNVGADQNLSWTGGDPDPGDTVTYDVYLGISNPPPLLATDEDDTTYSPGGLGFDQTYYWKIVSRDEWGAENEGPIWNFTTAIGVCGDADGSGDVDIDDVVYLINYIFVNGPPPDPLCIGDADGSGDVDIDDVVYLINYIFVSGPAPVPDCCG